MNLIKHLIIIMISSIIFGCKETNPPVEPENHLHADLVAVYLHANLEPPPAPDPIIYYVLVRIWNTSSNVAIGGLSFDKGIVRLVSTGQELGSFALITNWDGYINSLESDTVFLEKNENR